MEPCKPTGPPAVQETIARFLSIESTFHQRDWSHRVADAMTASLAMRIQRCAPLVPAGLAPPTEAAAHRRRAFPRFPSLLGKRGKRREATIFGSHRRCPRRRPRPGRQRHGISAYRSMQRRVFGNSANFRRLARRVLPHPRELLADGQKLGGGRLLVYASRSPTETQANN